MITYKKVNRNIRVYLDGRAIGTIRLVAAKVLDTGKVQSGYRYFPNGQREGGEVFDTVEACKKSLDDPEETEHWREENGF